MNTTVLVSLIALCLCTKTTVIANEQADSANKAHQAKLFLNAARDGKLDIIKQMLDAGIDVNMAGKSGFTALMVAVYTEKLGSIDLLLERRARVNQTNDAGSTAIKLVLTNKANSPFKKDILYQLLKANRYVHPEAILRSEKSPEQLLVELQSLDTDDARKKVACLEQGMEILQDERRCTVAEMVLTTSRIFPRSSVIDRLILSFVSQKPETPQEREETVKFLKELSNKD